MRLLYADLARALCVRKIARAGLDVYKREPQIESALLQMKNVVLAPRIARPLERQGFACQWWPRKT